MHRTDHLEEPVGVGVGDVAAQVLADLVLVEWQQGEDQVVLASHALATLTVEERELLLDGPEVLRPAGQEETGWRWFSFGTGSAEGEDFEEGAGEALPVAWGEVDQDLVKAIEDDQGGFTADGVQHVIGHDRGLGRNTEEAREQRAEPEIGQTRGGEVAQVEVDGQRHLLPSLP